jgi:hypothetical protein
LTPGAPLISQMPGSVWEKTLGRCGAADANVAAAPVIARMRVFGIPMARHLSRAG